MLLNILIAWIGLFILVSFFWVWGYLKKNPSVIDAGWSLGILLAGTLFIVYNDNFSYSNYVIDIYWFLLLSWSVRLSVYLYLTRIYQNKVDKRYLRVSELWTINKSLGFFIHYQFQAILMLLVALPFFFIAKIKFNQFNLLNLFAILIISFAIIGETIADFQLYKYKKANRGSICQIGLWYYSRHPNYFFEWLIWVGFSIAALSVPFGYLSLLSPLLLLYLFIFVTGPITETGSIKNHGAVYINYQTSTSMFIPWFKKRGSYDPDR